MKYTQQQYEASAKKHGITPGPWQHKSYTRLNEIAGGNSHAPVVGWMGFDDSDRPFEEHQANAKSIASLPDLLIALDEKDAEIERLRGALRHIAEYWNGRDNQSAMSDALREMQETADTVLQGGGA